MKNIWDVEVWTRDEEILGESLSSIWSKKDFHMKKFGISRFLDVELHSMEHCNIIAKYYYYTFTFHTFSHSSLISYRLTWVGIYYLWVKMKVKVSPSDEIYHFRDEIDQMLQPTKSCIQAVLYNIAHTDILMIWSLRFNTCCSAF